MTTSLALGASKFLSEYASAEPDMAKTSAKTRLNHFSDFAIFIE